MCICICKYVDMYVCIYIPSNQNFEHFLKQTTKKLCFHCCWCKEKKPETSGGTLTADNQVVYTTVSGNEYWRCFPKSPLIIKTTSQRSEVIPSFLLLHRKCDHLDVFDSSIHNWYARVWAKGNIHFCWDPSF